MTACRASEDPRARPANIQRLIDQIEIADLLEADVVPSWLCDRLLADAEAVLRAIAGLTDWPEQKAWEGVEWTGAEYRLLQ